MKVLVTYAVEAEFAPWRKLRNPQAATINGLELFHVPIGRAAVDFVVTGMGQENARRVSEIAMCAPYTFCVAAGFAGALKANLKIGDILVVRAVQELGKSKTLECSRDLFMAAREDPAMEAKMLLTVDRVITTVLEKQQLSAFGDAVDMESFTTLSVAEEKKLPAVAIRVISDRFDQDMPQDLDMTVDERGQVKLGGVVKHLAKHPLHLPALIRLGRQSTTAAEALAAFLETFIQQLSFRPHGWPPSELSEVRAS
jgi:adenosylhomocysteine nucleosidase